MIPVTEPCDAPANGCCVSAAGLTVGVGEEKEAPKAKEAPKNPLLGTWELVRFKSGDGEFTDFPKDRRRLKLITDTHWSWVEYSTAGPKEAKDGAGGPYTLKRDDYAETIEFATGGMVGGLDKTLLFKIRVEGDKCFVSWTLANGLKYEDIWQRVVVVRPSPSESSGEECEK